MSSGGVSFEARLIKANGHVETIELHSDEFFLDNLLESELRTKDVDFYWVHGHAIVYDIWAKSKNSNRNGTATRLVGHTVFGDVVLIPRRYIRRHGNLK